MKWFGSPGGAAYERDSPHIETPVGQPCAWCDELFVDGDAGVALPLFGSAETTDLAYHYECHLRQVVGGLNHQRGNCTCCGGREPPDPIWLTRRQAAVQAVRVWHQRTQGR